MAYSKGVISFIDFFSASIGFLALIKSTWEKIKFENNVNYSVTIEHAMRYLNKIGGIEKLHGIMDIGYKVEFVEWKEIKK